MAATTEAATAEAATMTAATATTEAGSGDGEGEGEGVGERECERRDDGVASAGEELGPPERRGKTTASTGSGRARGNACCTAAPAPATCQPLLRWPCEQTGTIFLYSTGGQRTKVKGQRTNKG